jgi:hypothetical protein
MKVILIFMILSVPDEGYSNLYDFERHYVIKSCQWYAADWWFSPGTPVSSTN